MFSIYPFQKNKTPKSSRQKSRQKLNRWQGIAIVETAIKPDQTGRVKFQGSHWNARCSKSVTLIAGSRVEVIGIKNISLIVEPVDH